MSTTLSFTLCDLEARCRCSPSFSLYPISVMDFSTLVSRTLQESRQFKVKDNVVDIYVRDKSDLHSQDIAIDLMIKTPKFYTKMQLDHHVACILGHKKDDASERSWRTPLETGEHEKEKVYSIYNGHVVAMVFDSYGNWSASTTKTVYRFADILAKGDKQHRANILISFRSKIASLIHQGYTIT